MQKSVKAYETGKADEEGVKGTKRTKKKTNEFQEVNLRAHLSREFTSATEEPKITDAIN